MLPFDRGTRLFTPGGSPRLNGAHPLASGLVGAWYFGNGGVPITNLCSGKITVGSGTGILPGMGSEGACVNCANGSASIYAVNEPLLSPSAVSVYSRVLSNGTNTNQPRVVCNSKQSGNFDGFALQNNGSGFWNWYTASSVTAFSAVGNAIPTNVVCDAMGTCDGATSILYENGIKTQSGATGLDYTGSAGAFLLNNTGSSNCWSGKCFVIYIWNRVLSAVEALAVHLTPYSLLIFPEDDLFAELVGITSVSGISGGAWGASAWGRRAWGLPPLVAGGTNSFLAAWAAGSSKVVDGSGSP